jgi:hypothetical protein
MYIIEDSTRRLPDTHSALFKWDEEPEYGSREILFCETCGHVMVLGRCDECDPLDLADLFG